EIQLTDDGSRTLIHQPSGVAYHSGCGARTECDHVYVRNGGLIERAEVGPNSVLEIGFGTGMAMLRTLHAVAADSDAGGLSYVAVENNPLHPSIVASVLDSQDEMTSHFLRQWSEWFDHDRPRSSFTFHWAMCDLQVIITNAELWLADTNETFDVIYFDPFDPESNPKLWTPEVYRDLFRILNPNGRLVSYCVKSRVRREMASIGFDAQCVPGPPDGKREVLIATKVISQGQ
ncbi:MAG: tRNA (5-methylaminomethyl-2-thiouridine)(34)-methyltransferase MnmD, partial [Planctomycetota bacterium]